MKLGIFEWLLWSDSCLVKQLILIFLSKHGNFCIFFPDKHVSLITIVAGFEEEWHVLCHSYLSVPTSWMRAGVCHLRSSLITRKWKTNILPFHPDETVLLGQPASSFRPSPPQPIAGLWKAPGMSWFWVFVYTCCVNFSCAYPVLQKASAEEEKNIRH